MATPDEQQFPDPPTDQLTISFWRLETAAKMVKTTLDRIISERKGEISTFINASENDTINGSIDNYMKLQNNNGKWAHEFSKVLDYLEEFDYMDKRTDSRISKRRLDSGGEELEKCKQVVSMDVDRPQDDKECMPGPSGIPKRYKNESGVAVPASAINYGPGIMDQEMPDFATPATQEVATAATRELPLMSPASRLLRRALRLKLQRIRNAERPQIGDIVFVSCYVSPSEFYLYVATENTNMLTVIDQQVDLFCRETAVPYNHKAQAYNAIGEFCAVNIPAWRGYYRAHVLSWLQDHETDVFVQLVDYGHTVKTTFQELVALPDGYCYYPRLAVKCHLAHLYSPESTTVNLAENWTTEGITELRGILNPCDKSTCFKITYVDDGMLSFGIDLQKIEPEVLDVSRSFVEAGHAVKLIAYRERLIQQDQSFVRDPKGQIEQVFVIDGIDKKDDETVETDEEVQIDERVEKNDKVEKDETVEKDKDEDIHLAMN